MKKEELLFTLENYRYHGFPAWLTPLYELLKCKTEDEAVLKLRKFRIKEASYNDKIDKFKQNFPEQEEELNYLKKIYTMYKEQYVLKKEMPNNQNKVYVDILYKILNSGYTMEEYCAVYGNYTLKELKAMVLKIHSTHRTIQEDFEAKCMCSSETFIIYLKKIAKLMSKIENFTLFDYYYYTKLNPFDFIELCKKYLTNEELKNIKPIIGRLRSLVGAVYGTVNMRRDIDNVTIIQGRQITSEEKLSIIEYLEADKIPSVAYQSALRKYVAGDERLVGCVNQSEKIKCK